MFPIYTSKTWLHWQSIMTTGWQVNPQTLHHGNQIGAHQFYNQMQTGRSEMSACSTGSPGMDSSHTSTAGQLTNPAARDDRIRRKLRRGRSRGARTSDGVVVLGRAKEEAAGAADPIAEGLDSGRNPRWASRGRSWAAAGRRCSTRSPGMCRLIWSGADWQFREPYDKHQWMGQFREPLGWRGDRETGSGRAECLN
jgi:hypothetical protein